VSVYEALRDALRGKDPVALATVVEGPNVGAKLLVRPDAPAVGSLGNHDLDRVVARDALGELEAGLTSTRHYGTLGEARELDVSVFIESFALPPRLIIFGAVDFTAALAKVAKVLGYRVTVCDARAVFATVQRFPMADEVVNDWPDRYLAKVGDELGPRDAILFDGAGHLMLWTWWRLRDRLRAAGVLIVTAHRAHRGPVVVRTATSPELLRELVAELDPTVGDAQIRDACHEARCDLRAALRSLYESAWINRPAPDPTH